uniref:NADH-ubiquinone oxidoreductase chain 5 n=1 Tax=Harmostica fulvicornis TaxID=2813413 RepID=A0A8T9W0T8_9HEMI|nr:NADH dehydrogenase subunit 5 [Harmostica fulvicornis]UPI55332.1 NADH dehydrogenase subunit 5 [Harmostica fulvicornis]
MVIFNLYKLWFMIFLFVGLCLYLLGLYYLFIDYVVLLDWEILFLNSSFTFTVLLDWMSLLFMGSVMLITSMVIFYSLSYMMDDLYSVRFLFLIILFVISMCLMIISPNLFSILLGWDGLGLISYCLVIYFCNFKSYCAGMLTVLVNRVGDVAILLGIGLMLNKGSLCFIYYLFNFDWGNFLFMLVVLASFTKSAQIPFSSWLPAAMAAPTPVSALVHSSTLVTAGVYLLIRFSPLIDCNMSGLLMLSVLTMFMSGLGAVYETDMSKIIALSTLSQLGLMMSILFIGYPVVSFFHLLTHAFFKALLFLCSGLLIHGINGVQDIRYLGSLLYNFPYTMMCFGVANLSLCGLPFLSGFYSKDLIVELMMISGQNFFIFVLFYLSIGLTACYSLRLLYYCVINYVGLLPFGLYHEDFSMMFSMFSLTMFGIFSGSLLLWLILPVPIMVCLPFFMKFMIMMVCLPFFMKFMIMMFVFFGFLFGYLISIQSMNSVLFMNSIYLWFLGSMWFMPFLNVKLGYKSLNLCYNYQLVLEQGWGEYLISNLLLNMMLFFSKFISLVHNNTIKVFFMLFFIYSLLMFLV